MKLKLTTKYNHASLISLENQMTEKYLDSPASETLTPFVYQASQFIPANRQLEYSPQNQGLGVLITSQTQKLQSFINANENTAL